MISRQLFTVCVSVFLIVAGLSLIFGAPAFFEYILRTELILTPSSKTFQSWVQLPTLLPMDIYLFNWTNPEEITVSGTKPKFEQLGPYRFMMDMKKVNVTWNQNGTVTYKAQKFWYFSPEGTNGSLQDRITTINTPALGAAHMVRSWVWFARIATSMVLNKFYTNISTTTTVDELLFKGYHDGLTSMSSAQSLFTDPDMPKWDKFGLFYERNGTIKFENPYNIGTGQNSRFANVYNWNYWNQTPYFDGECGKVDGSCGDSFDASGDTIKMYLPDVCRYMVLQYVGNVEISGITGRKYVLGELALDNGTKYDENLCFNKGEILPSGVFNVSSCRFGSPSLMSLPHFYQADSYYTSMVEGLNPEGERHEFSMIVEPRTGIPLQANVRLQLNMYLHSVSSISLFEKAPTVVFPIMWFEQKGSVPDNEVPMLKLLLNISTIGLYAGLTVIMLGIILLLIIVATHIRSRRPNFIKNTEETVPLKSKKNVHTIVPVNRQ